MSSEETETEVEIEVGEEERAERVYIRQAAESLNRRMATLRKWEQIEALPEHLRSHRGHRGWRYWTPSQIDGIREWLRDTDRRPGKGLPHYNPTALQLDRAISAMRKPRGMTSRTATGSVPDSALPKSKRPKKPPPKPAPRRAKRPGT